VVLPSLSILAGESHFLVSSCVCDRCDMAGSDEDCGGSRRLGTEDRGWSSIDRGLDGRMLERLGAALCGLHRAQGDEYHGFLALASKPWSTVSPGFSSKPVALGVPVWPQNRQL
jgi:hypothetical protein